jgi:hypothetical protein
MVSLYAFGRLAACVRNAFVLAPILLAWCYELWLFAGALIGDKFSYSELACPGFASTLPALQGDALSCQYANLIGDQDIGLLVFIIRQPQSALRRFNAALDCLLFGNDQIHDNPDDRYGANYNSNFPRCEVQISAATTQLRRCRDGDHTQRSAKKKPDPKLARHTTTSSTSPTDIGSYIRILNLDRTLAI